MQNFGQLAGGAVGLLDVLCNNKVLDLSFTETTWSCGSRDTAPLGVQQPNMCLETAAATCRIQGGGNDKRLNKRVGATLIGALQRLAVEWCG